MYVFNPGVSGLWTWYGIDFLDRLNVFATDGLRPDLVFCFDIDVDTMKKRLNNKDGIESRGDEFFRRVRQGYIELARKLDYFFLIDGKRAEKQVFKDVVSIWESL